MMEKTTGRMERKKEETRNNIINTAIELFHQNGLQAVTMEQIADAADIAKGTLYNYFPSKEAIIAAFIQRTSEERNPDRVAQLRQLPDTRARMIHAFHLLVEGVQREKEIFEVFWAYRIQQVISFRSIEGEQGNLSVLIEEIIRLGQESGELRTDLPDDLLKGLFEYAFVAAIKPFYLEPESYHAGESIERCVDLFMNGAKA